MAKQPSNLVAFRDFAPKYTRATLLDEPATVIIMPLIKANRDRMRKRLKATRHGEKPSRPW